MYFYSSNTKFKYHWAVMILWSLVILLIGIYILVDTHDFTQILAWAFGVYQLVSGVFSIILYSRLYKTQSVSRMILWQGVLRFLVGLLALLLPVLVVKLTWIMMLYLLAAQCFISAGMDFSVAWRIQRTGFPLGVSPNQHYGNAFFSLLTGMVLILAPRFLGLFLLNMISFILILIGSALLVIFTRLWWHEKHSLVSH